MGAAEIFLLRPSVRSDGVGIRLQEPRLSPEFVIIHMPMTLECIDPLPYLNLIELLFVPIQQIPKTATVGEIALVTI